MERERTVSSIRFRDLPGLFFVILVFPLLLLPPLSLSIFPPFPALCSISLTPCIHPTYYFVTRVIVQAALTSFVEVDVSCPDLGGGCAKVELRGGSSF
jgi:hypothetical protein